MVKFVELCCIIALLGVAYTIANDLQCDNQTMYQENGCNYCFCLNGELAYCTLKLCTSIPFYEKAKTCTVNTEWQQDCNSCMCVKNYGTLCTFNICVSKSKSRSTLLL